MRETDIKRSDIWDHLSNTSNIPHFLSIYGSITLQLYGSSTASIGNGGIGLSLKYDHCIGIAHSFQPILPICLSPVCSPFSPNVSISITIYQHGQVLYYELLKSKTSSSFSHLNSSCHSCEQVEHDAARDDLHKI